MATSARKKSAAPARKSRPRRSKGKIIIILSDGTGNGAAALFKTNIWRLYRALDLSEVPRAGVRQIAYYDDGVGTSSFRPLALLGGAFGVGLKRNVLDLYRFVCRNYEDGDRIFAFGFSRGAFTVRVAVGLLAMEGILKCETEADLHRYSVDAYRRLRKEFKQGRWFPALPIEQNEGAGNSDDVAEAGVVVRLFRWIRDQCVRVSRKRSAHKLYEEIVGECRKPLSDIAFVGVFDTVAAYGMPLAELTRGIDDWIWPLSMPDYKLSANVRTARHALALDDERDTFHPLVWDEHEEERLVEANIHPPGRMKQVWFSGMHADVGGGYPDDAVAQVPLLWMIGEAKAAGLRFEQSAVDAIEREANVFAPLHDSRRGVGSYYRLQPRKIAARVDPPDRTAMIMQDPKLEDRGMLKTVVVHESVFDRIERGTDRSATIVLPARYEVEGYDGKTAISRESTEKAGKRANRQEWVWNLVWLRRVIYFTTVGVSILMVVLPLLANPSGRYECGGPLCFVSAAITTVGQFLPAFLETWIDFYSAQPFLFLVFVVALGALMMTASAVQRRMRDSMRILWQQSLGLDGADAEQSRNLSGDPTASRIYRLRTDDRYQFALRYLKWKIVPAVFGLALVILILNLAAAVLIRSLFWHVCNGDGGLSLLRLGAMCWLAN